MEKPVTSSLWSKITSGSRALRVNAWLMCKSVCLPLRHTSHAAAAVTHLLMPCSLKSSDSPASSCSSAPLMRGSSTSAFLPVLCGVRCVSIVTDTQGCVRLAEDVSVAGLKQPLQLLSNTHSAHRVYDVHQLLAGMAPATRGQVQSAQLHKVAGWLRGHQHTYLICTRGTGPASSAGSWGLPLAMLEWVCAPAQQLSAGASRPRHHSPETAGATGMHVFELLELL